jgi:hypothetical protein
MTNIDFPTLVTTIFVLVDDWCKRRSQEVAKVKPGAKAQMSDSEITNTGIVHE